MSSIVVLDGGLATELIGDRIRDGERCNPVRPRELERQVAGDVTVGGIGRPFDLDRRAIRAVGPRGEAAAGLGLVPRAFDRGADLGADGDDRGRGTRGHASMVARRGLPR